MCLLGAPAEVVAAPASSPERFTTGATISPQQRYRVELPAATSGIVDPRAFPDWRARDERLTRAMVVTGGIAGFTGALFLGSLIYLGTFAANRDPRCCIDGYPGIFPAMITGPLALLGLAGFSGVAIARRIHRRPLRRYQARPSLAGLQIQF
ncbi:hypothetical protein OV079_36810 [Nannocystis pusilla]|uniref:Uncharacterized protein n=1 Tax=Nannocystis pusilla TaxID=889268 RepID=A0A9X3J1E3_9BACT|nr:hypothetical protein [Nannocystis pusilla]MCY1011035.1 hypothetical protein [Nannocystis pusilla]